jgi:hypothetical protein
MKSLSFLLLAALSAIPTPQLFAQEGESNPLDPVQPRAMLLLGPTIGVNRNFHTGGFRTIIADASCPVFNEGSGWGFSAGVSAEFLFGESWSIVPRILYEQRPGSFTQDLPDALVQLPIDSVKFDLVKQHVSTSSEIGYGLATVQAFYKQELAMLGEGRFGVLVGPEVNFVISGHNRQVLDLIEPENARLTNPKGFDEENNGRTLVFYDDKIPEAESIRFALKVGMQVEIGLFGNAWIMTPGLYYDYGLTDVTKAENWGLSTLSFLIDFRRAL